MDTKKKNISLRLSESDIERARKISNRLEVKEADLLRFAVKFMLIKLAPFQDDAYVGTDLMPAVLEVGQDLIAFFDMTDEDLDRVINSGKSDDHRLVDLEDLKLLALAGLNEGYARMKMATQDRGLDDLSIQSYLSKKYFERCSANSEKPASTKANRSDWPVFISGGMSGVVPETA